MKGLIFTIIVLIVLIASAYFKIENNYLFFGVELALLFCVFKIVVMLLDKYNSMKTERNVKS